MRDLLKRLCLADGVSGGEGSIAEIIKQEIDGYVQYHTDGMGNIIAFKKGKNRAKNKLMLDAHTDEVGMIITSVTSDGFLKFETVGSINPSALLCRKVTIEGKINGVIGTKPIHLCKGDEKENPPKEDSLYIDIGAASKEAAMSLVSIGDFATFKSDYTLMGDDCVKSKALDDRIGCAILITLLKQEAEYDFYATFTVQEEVGCRGARTAAFAVSPDFAICLEATTAADIADLPEDKKVCCLNKGAAVSFMDRATLYDRSLYNCALNSGILCQSKKAVAGGNNSGAVHLSKEGIRTLAVSVPCRYIHSASCLCSFKDIESALNLAQFMCNKICSGDIE
ncbi:MAG: M42 family peptidase [Clostridia bacterium]|nr:M42 family peptidase [Clostridia bacterium]